MSRLHTRFIWKRLARGVDGIIALALLACVVWAAGPHAHHSAAARPALLQLSGGCEAAPAASAPAAADPPPAATPIAIDRSGLPPVLAHSYAVIDASNGRVLAGRRIHERRAPASTTKIMTGILAVESGMDENSVLYSTVDASSMVGSSVMGLTPDIGVTQRDLLYGLMLPSGNDAALELARDLAGSEEQFVDVMNQKAAQIGMADTHFMNPHGLDAPNHYSSAYDLALLGRYAMTNPRFREIAGTTTWHLSSPFDYDITNGNTLLGAYPGVDGVKIGWTEDAGWTFVASAERDGHHVIVALMNTEDRNYDAAGLFDWAFGSPYWTQPPAEPQPVAPVVTAPAAPTAATTPVSGACPPQPSQPTG